MPARESLVHLHQVTKHYSGLRPLRVSHFELHAGEAVALLGFDQLTAELLVNLMTGAVLPDTGEVLAMGQLTAGIVEADAWVQTLDQFGLISERAVLLDQLTVEQNLTLPLSLEIDTPSDQLRQRVRALAEEVGLGADDLGRPLGSVTAAARLRVRLGRALALGPRVLLAEHPNATLEQRDAAPFAADLARVARARDLALLVLTADRTFAHAAADVVLTLQPATGELKQASGWRRWW